MPMDFLSELDDVEGGAYVKGYKRRFDDPIEAARFNFAKNGKEQIDMITAKNGKVNKSGYQTGNMFEELAGGKFKVTLKNGISILELKPGKTYWLMADADKACQFIAKAIVAAEGGEFDDFFKATARKAKSDEKTTGDKLVDSVKASKTNGAHAST